MLKRMICVWLLALICTVPLTAEVDIPWQLGQQKVIEEAVEQCRQILSPFSAEAGFPDNLPPELIGKTWEEIRVKVAEACFKCSRIFKEMIEKQRFPVRIRLGAKYFQKRFVLGTHIYPHQTASSRVHEFQCRDFAKACEIGLREMKYWAAPEPVWTGDMVWAKNAREGLNRVKSMLPLVPERIADAEAKSVWQKCARELVFAGNEAGMTASRIGGFDFPAWRLKFAVKYFKAHAKAAVAGSWYARESAPLYWQQACIKLRAAVEPVKSELDELLQTLAD